MNFKFWYLAGGVVAMVAARVAMRFRERRIGRSGRFTTDQVSGDWLAQARIHEDQA